MLKLQPAVKQDTFRIAAGTICLVCVMLLVFLAIGQFDQTVLLGAILGTAAAVGNFFFMALTIQKAVESMKDTPPPPPADPAADGESGEENPPPSPLSQAAKQRVQLSYSLRMLAIVAVGIIGLTVDLFHPLAVLLPLLFPRIVIFLIGKVTKPDETEG